MSPAPRQSPNGRTGVPHRGGPRGRPWHPPHELRDAGPDPAAAAQGAPRRATAGGRKRAATIGQRLVRARPTNADRRPRPTPRGDSPTTGLVPPITNIITNMNELTYYFDERFCSCSFFLSSIKLYYINCLRFRKLNRFEKMKTV